MHDLLRRNTNTAAATPNPPASPHSLREIGATAMRGPELCAAIFCDLGSVPDRKSVVSRQNRFSLVLTPQQPDVQMWALEICTNYYFSANR
jgi:hypothetical protein